MEENKNIEKDAKTTKKPKTTKKETSITKIDEKTKNIDYEINEIKENMIKEIDKVKNDGVENTGNIIEKNFLTKKLDFTVIEGLVLLLIFVIIFGILGYFIGDFKEKDLTYDENLSEFIEHYNNVKNNYYGEIDDVELINGAVEGMLSVLDEYSEFLDNTSNSFDIELQGSYKGVGIEVYNDALTGEIIVSNVFENTPASKSGILPGDVVISFNGEDMTAQTTSYLVDKIAENDDINLTLRRGEETIEISLAKEFIELQSISYELLEGEVGYIKIDVFASNTATQLEKALVELEKQGMKSLVLDVRNNSGGYLSAAEDIISLFVDESHVIYKTDFKDEIETIYSTGKETKTYPIAILQNFGSASASELLAISLKENLNAYIVGTTSFGKGTVQTVQEINGVEYKMTTKKWLSPQGNWINEIGIVPDQELILEEGYYLNPTKENDNVLQGAITYLKGV